MTGRNENSTARENYIRRACLLMDSKAVGNVISCFRQVFIAANYVIIKLSKYFFVKNYVPF